MKRKMNDTAQRHATALQRQALAPEASVFIAANAGTGKTEVLTYRMIALLLADPGLLPSAILAVTFTNAAAAEMNARLTKILRDWQTLAEPTLQKTLEEVTGFAIGAAELARFHQLPALVADAPPLLTTMHALAQQVLRRQPGANGLPETLELIETLHDDGLLAEALAQAVTDASDGEAAALDLLLATLGDNAWRDASELVEKNWRRLSEVVTRAEGVAAFVNLLRQELGLQDEDTEAALKAAMVPTAAERAALEVLAPKVENSLKAWLGYLFIKDGEGTPTQRGFPAVAPLVKAHPQEAEVLRTAQERVAALRERLRALKSFELTQALLVWWSAVRRSLESLKAERRVRTFGDLMDGLENGLKLALADEAEGIRLGQRLERRFQHLLLDEAQDNDPQQARVVEMLARVFLAGDVGSGKRTVLAVGDPKQSIYRFKGAQPKLFGQLKDFLGRWDERLVEVSSAHSFRASAPLLEAVEKVFTGDEARAAVGGEWVAHETVFPDIWGRVEVWSLTPVPKKEEAEGFAVEPKPQWLADGPNVFGQQLAIWLKEQRAARVVLPSTGEALAWKDVLVIVQTNAVAAALAGALNAGGVPAVAVETGGTLAPVVSDVVALLRLVHAPAHRLALAQVLKSPLCGWSDAQLMHLAELGEDWWSNVAQVNAATAAWLGHWQARARAVPPGVWLAELCQRPEVIVGYAARGPLPAAAVRAALAGVVMEAQSYQSIPALLVVWEEHPPLPLGGGGDAVTVMTVHKAKGLGYPLVVLAQTTRRPKIAPEEKLAWRENEMGDADLVLLRQTKNNYPPELQNKLDTEEEKRLIGDQWRTLYVAMTRAKDWLVVGGWGENAGDDNWYGWIKRGLGEATPLQNGPFVHAASQVAEAPRPLPAWATPPLPLALPVWPEEEPYLAERETALRQGTLQHRLLHMLAGLPAAERGAAAQASKADPTVLPAVLRVFEQFHDLFGPGSRGEVSVVVNGTEGRLDRLVERGEEVWIIDFKTEAEPPAQAPATYRAQLAAYNKAIAPAYPGKTIRTGILWLATPKLEWL